MSRELLEECGLFVSCASDFTKDQRIDLLSRIKAELAKPEPEPVGYANIAELDRLKDRRISGRPVFVSKEESENRVSIYTNPPRQQAPVRLSDDSIIEIHRNNCGEHITYVLPFARAIEQSVLKANGLEL